MISKRKFSPEHINLSLCLDVIEWQCDPLDLFADICEPLSSGSGSQLLVSMEHVGKILEGMYGKKGKNLKKALRTRHHVPSYGKR